MGAEKVNVVGAQAFTSKTFEIKYKEEAKYLDHRLEDFWAQGKGNHGLNYYNDRCRDRSREKDGDWCWKDDYKEKSDRYVPQGSHDSESWMVALL